MFAGSNEQSFKTETIVLIIIVIIIIFFVARGARKKQEKYSMGALNQLMAKGAQDEYLTVGTTKYWANPYWNNYWYNKAWYYPFGYNFKWYRNSPVVVDRPLIA
jgi:hypothetical protein